MSSYFCLKLKTTSLIAPMHATANQKNDATN